MGIMMMMVVGDVKIYDDDTDVYVEEHSYDKHVEHGHDYVGDSDD